MTEKKKKPTTDQDTKNLVKALKSTGFVDYVQYMKSPWRIVWTNFLGGIFRGLGIIVGMTIVVSLLLWMIAQMVDFPLIGQFFKDLLDFIEQSTVNKVEPNLFRSS